MTVMGIAHLLQALVSNPGILFLLIALYAKESLGLSATETTLLGGLSILPWTLKPLWGLICDSFLLFELRFRADFVICYGVVAIAPQSSASLIHDLRNLRTLNCGF